MGTHEKYQILEGYCHPLSLIMRNNNLDHYFIDACAGSGKVQAYHSDDYIDGSPLIMAKTRNWVEENIVDKTKPKHLRCIFIEVNPKAHILLEKWTHDFPNCEKLWGDCNRILPAVLDDIDSGKRKPFAFIYVDPFGLGDPPIMMETLGRILARGYTELFLQLGVDALIRVSGWLRHLDSPDPDLCKQARSCYETLKVTIGADRIGEFCENWPRWKEGEKEQKTLEYYLSGLRGYFPHVECIGIPLGSNRPVYYLIYTTRNDTGQKIMQGIVATAKRKGTEPLSKWFKQAH